jgi:hypothetical protein
MIVGYGLDMAKTNTSFPPAQASNYVAPSAKTAGIPKLHE